MATLTPYPKPIEQCKALRAQKSKCRDEHGFAAERVILHRSRHTRVTLFAKETFEEEWHCEHELSNV